MSDAELEHLGDRADLWKAYKCGGDATAREKLVLEFAELVRYVAGQMAMGMPAEVQPSELETYGIFGLIDALDKFDISRGIKFETYATTRIRGAILDGVRSMDWVPSSVRRKGREIEDAGNELRARLGRSPTDEEAAEYLGISVRRYREDVAHVAQGTVMYLDEPRSTDEITNVDTLLSFVPDTEATDPFEAAAWSAQRDRLAEAISELSEQEQLVVALYYYEGLTLSEIAEVMELSPSRISQVHSRAVMRLRGKLSSVAHMFETVD